MTTIRIGGGEVRMNGRKIGDLTVAMVVTLDLAEDPYQVGDEEPRRLRRRRHLEERGEFPETTDDRPAFVAAIVTDEDGSRRTYAHPAGETVEGVIPPAHHVRELTEGT